MSLFKRLKKLKEVRKEYKIKPIIKFTVDKSHYLFSFLPTVMWQPWIYRYLHTYVVDIQWLHFHIVIGEWIKAEF